LPQPASHHSIQSARLSHVTAGSQVKESRLEVQGSTQRSTSPLSPCVQSTQLKIQPDIRSAAPEAIMSERTHGTATAQSQSRGTQAYMYAFDFDGVLCDSAGETGTMGLAALKALVPTTPVSCLSHVLACLLSHLQRAQRCTFHSAAEAISASWKCAPWPV
jgi:hypothetical protein